MALCLAVSCRTIIPLEDIDPSVEYSFHNDTKFDCIIIWDEFNNPGNINQLICIPSDSVYIQHFFPNDGSGLSFDGKSCLVIGFDSQIKFNQIGTNTLIYDYLIPWEGTISTNDCFWSHLPHYEFQQIRNSDSFCNVHSYYLSDVLDIAMKQQSSIQ